MNLTGTIGRTAARAILATGVLLSLSVPAGCARNVNDYLAEARSGTPSSVKDAVVAIGQILYRKESAGIPYDKADQEAVLYLKEVATTDTVPMDRAEAIASLGPLRKADAGEVLLAGLKDSFWLVRFQSVRAMGHSADEKYAQPLRDLLATETRPEVRLEVVKGLGMIKGPIALRTLLEVFLGSVGEIGLDPQVLAYLSIKEMTGLNHGFEDAKSWKAFYRSKYGELPGSGPPGLPPAGEGGTAAPPKATGEKAGEKDGEKSGEKATQPEKPPPPPAKAGIPPPGGEDTKGQPPPVDRSPNP